MKILKHDWQPLFGPLIIILVWALIKRFKIVDDIFLPPLDKTFIAIGYIFSQEGLVDVFMTLYRTIASTTMACLIAVPLGLLLGHFTSLYRKFEVIIDFFRSVPATAFFPLFILAFGIGNTSIIALSTFVSLWVILVNSIYGVWNCPKVRIKLAKSFGANNLFLFTNTIFFDALPQILIGIRLALSLSLVIVIVSEMLMGTQYGLGRIVYESYATYQSAKLYAGIFLIGLMGYSLNKISRDLEKKIVHWVGH